MKYELPVCTPESVGIPSEAIERFLRRLEERYLPMHSVLMSRNGKLCFENYWEAFDKDKKHRMYSTSKSFVSAAIGILIGDGKLALDDKITKFFPDKVPENLHPYTAAATVRDLLMMATPHLYEHCTYSPDKPDWADTYFQTPPTHLPGKIFSYDTTATTMLSIIIARITGKEFPEFLRDRLFIPAGMSDDITCIETPCGHAWGGSGVLATPRDLMKFAGVFMNGGRTATGEQVIPEWYAVEATSRQIDNTLTADDYEHTFGYGYQFWRNRHGFSCRGMGSQLAICLPEQNFILVTTGDTQSVPSACCAIYEALWKEIYPYLVKNETLAENPDAYAALNVAWNNHPLMMLPGEKTSPRMAEVSDKTYRMDAENELKWYSARVEFTERSFDRARMCRSHFRTDRRPRMSNIIEVRNLSYVYGKDTPFEKKALDNVNLDIKKGEILGIIGHTGSGKSTLLQLLNGLLKPTSGTITFNGKNIWADDVKIRDLRFRVGLVFQYPEYQLFEETVRRDIAFGPKNMGLGDDEIAIRVNAAAEFVGLEEDILDVSPFELSGGQKRRVAIAGVAAMEPDVLVLDEPTAGLDPFGRSEILTRVCNYQSGSGQTVVLVTHSMDDIAKVADRIAVLYNSKIIMCGTPSEIFSHTDELEQMGLAVPEISMVFGELRRLGVDVDPSIYTLDDAVRVLCEMKGGGVNA